jgi:hypothetical protein
MGYGALYNTFMVVNDPAILLARVPFDYAQGPAVGYYIAALQAAER